MKGVLRLMIKRTLFNIKFCCKKYCRVGSKQIATKLRVKLLREAIKNIERTDLKLDNTAKRHTRATPVHKARYMRVSLLIQINES